MRARTGGDVLAVPGDVCCDEDVERVVSTTVERFGGIDVLVNNAGGSRAHPFLEATEEIWREDLEIKVFGRSGSRAPCCPICGRGAAGASST